MTRPALLVLLLSAIAWSCGDDASRTATGPEASSAADTDTATAADTYTATDTPLPPPPPFDWCDGAPPDDACYAARRDPDSENIALARAIADRYLELHPARTLHWTWEQAVFGVGLYELYRVTGEASYLEGLRAWMDYRGPTAVKLIFASDMCAPILAAAFCYMESGEESYREMVEAGLHYLDNVATRTPHGGLNHWGPTDQPTLWVDSLFMFGNLLTRWGEYLPDPTRLDMMADQFRIFTEVLQSDGGLYVHAWGWSKPVDTDIYWGRGNGWVTASGYDYLRARKNRGETDAFVEQALALQVEAAIAAQDEDTGRWWIVLKRPGETYLETSTGALFAYGMARGYRYGFLGDEVLPVIAKAVEGMKEALTEDEQGRPVVSGVSVGTSAGTFEYYAGLGVADDLGYGVGSVLLALVESSGLPSGR